MEQGTMNMAQSQSDGELVIDLGEVFFLIWHHLALVIEAGLCLGAVVFLACTFLIPKSYVSTTRVYVLNKQSDSSVTVTYSELQSGSYLTSDYSELITSLPVMEKVVAQLNLDISPTKLAKQISVDTPSDTRIIDISVEDTDPYLAVSIADAVRIAAASQIAEVMDVASVNLVQRASYPETASGPARLKYTMLGCILGAVLAVVILFLIYILDDTIKGEDDVEKYLGISVLGTIPRLKSDVETKTKTKKKRKRSSRPAKQQS